MSRRAGKLGLFYVFPLIIYVSTLTWSHSRCNQFTSRNDEDIEIMAQRLEDDGVPSSERQTITSALRSMQDSTRSLADSLALSNAGGVFLIGVLSVSLAIRSQTASNSRPDDPRQGRA